jgi:nicotinate phosphoribosyltransferase
MRERREADIERLDPGVKRLINPHVYHVSLTQRLWELKKGLVASTLRDNGASSVGDPCS